MPQELHTAHEVQQVVEAGGQLLEVLPKPEYEELHLPGAIHIALGELESRAGELLDEGRAVVIYCWDSACDLSPRGAWALERMGFKEVYDYVPGKLDWMARGLPLEGERAEMPSAGTLARRNVPTCRRDERLGEVRERIGEASVCVVVNDQNVVEGILRSRELSAGGDAPVADVMKAAPSTYRPYVPIETMAEQLGESGLDSVPITTSDGTLVGVLFEEDAAEAASKVHAHHHQ